MGSRHGQAAAAVIIGTTNDDDDDPYLELAREVAAHYDGRGDLCVFLAAYLRPEHVARLPRAAGATLLSAVRRRAAAASLAGAVEKEKYGGAGAGAGDDGGLSAARCAICMEEYAAGDELSVVPCAGKHRFHRRCLAVWFERKRLCPLCRHALPAAAAVQAHGLSLGSYYY